MATPIKHRRTSTAGYALTTSDLVIAEIGFNLNDKKAFTSDGSATFEIGANTTTKTLGANSTQQGVNQSLVRTTTTGTSAQTLDTWAVASYRSASYTYSVKDNAANNFQTGSINVLYDGSVALATVFGVIYSNTYLGDFSVTANSTITSLQFTPTSANTTVSLAKTLITV